MPNDDISSSRRKLMQGATAGLMTAMAGHAMAQSGSNGPVGAPRGETGTPPDPRSLYPHPPFPAQSQPWPGLAGKMTPRPDHGEASYRGSGKLAGRRALITGGD